MTESFNPVAALAFFQLVLVVCISVRVIMNRPATGVALAWLMIVAMIPYFGAVIYLMIGERRITPRRMARLGQLREDYAQIAEVTAREGLTDVDWSRHPGFARDMNTLGSNVSSSHTYAGNTLELISNTHEILTRIAEDIDHAQTSVLMEFYIWHEGGTANEVVESLISAANRGVYCLVLVDALGASSWWSGKQPERMRAAGINLKAALPVGIFRTVVGRTDLRLHRKIMVVDGKTAWTGSMNLVDPRYFKQQGGFGEWVDAMARIQGTAVLPLAGVVIGDWVVETGDDLRETGQKAGIALPKPRGEADIQVISSGPGTRGNGLIKMMHAMINNAKKEIILTTPYLVPDDSLLWALRGAVGRNVRVVIIVPYKVDSFMTRHASHSYFDGMLNHGMEIYRYRGGLLHTKSITVDGEVSMFGTVNIDMRSLWLNNEVSLFVYDQKFTGELVELQNSYLGDSEKLEAEKWSNRSLPVQFLENTMRLMSPLL